MAVASETVPVTEGVPPGVTAQVSRAGEEAAFGIAVPAAPERVHLHMPVDVRSLSLAILAVLASVYALHWAQAVVVPVLLGLMFSYALTPLVDRLVHLRVPRAAAAGLIVSAIIAVLGWTCWALQDDAEEFIDTLPAISQKLRQIMQRPGTPSVGTIAKVQQAAAEISKAAEEGVIAPAVATSATATESRRSAAATTTTTVHTTVARPAHVVVERSSFDVRNYLWSGTMGLLMFLSQGAVVLLVTFFLLASGNTFRRKMVKLAGPKLSQKKLTIEALDEVTAQIQRFMLVQLVTSAIVGIATWLAFLALRMESPGIWGIIAFATNLIPYVGAVIVGAGSALAGVVQFGSLEPALLVGASSFAIHAVVGNLLTPWLTGRASRMSALAVFVGVLAFGWLWGPVGLILGVPILMVIKAVCDRVEELKPVGDFLGP